MTERGIGRCECEHERHWSKDGAPRVSHPFLTTLFVRSVTTTYGTFRVCRECEGTCLAAHIIQPQVRT